MTPKIKYIICAIFAAALSIAEYASSHTIEVYAAQRVDFNRDIKPIFEQACYACHGGGKALGQLRLDGKMAAMRGGISGAAIIPGDGRGSRLLQRILGEGAEARMPMGGEALSDAQIALIRAWIDQGASWPDDGATIETAKHWAFVKPVRPALPQVKDASRVKNPIDNFILSRLERENLTPSPEADRPTLIRRLSLDLTGLPPTPQEIDDFLNDRSAKAYEKVVDRLLASPRYGERMAFRWLDAARYADTNGYQIDGERSAWRWRDWVIESFNRNQPYDQFVIEQLAGDLLPNPTLDQLIATAFNRHHRINAEGGIVPEEYAVEYVVDRVDTTSTVFMGLTVGCARCHNHKYDPITQKEYYRLFAYFNSIPEDGRAFDTGNSAPWIVAPDREQQKELKKIEDQISETENAIKALSGKIAAKQLQWEKSLAAAPERQWFPQEKLLLQMSMNRGAEPVFNKSDRSHHNLQDKKPEDLKVKDHHDDPIGFKDGSPGFVVGPTGEAAAFDGKLWLDAGRRLDFRYKSTSVDFRERFTISLWIKPESENAGAIVTKMADKIEEKDNGLPRINGWGLFFYGGKIHFNMVREWNYDGFRAETETSLKPGEWRHIALLFNGFNQFEDRVQIFIDGMPAKLKVTQPNLYLYWGLPDTPLRIGGGGGPELRFKGAIDELRIYSRTADDEEIKILASPQPLNKIAAIPSSQRSLGQKLKINRAFFELSEKPASDNEYLIYSKNKELRARRVEMIDSFPTLMIMKELEAPRRTHLLRRGAYDMPGEEVGRGVPAVLPAMGEGRPNNRLGFAKWLVDGEHPLTSRVAVNRIWQMFFGQGLVKTQEDFGLQGEAPTHRELLDWLAAEFRESGWNNKALIKTIVGSAAYRQSSKITPQLLQKDFENRLYARGPRLRLPAETIRDQALFVSGLLVEKQGGPSVRPYQPDGLYKDMAFSSLTGYNRDSGEGLWRRSLYTFWKRTVLSPTMQVFDASAREFCSVREARTNTPLQSLNLMNDVTYVEAARMLAQRMLKEGGATPSERLSRGFRLAASRFPTERERSVLLRNLEMQLVYYKSNSDEAKRLLEVGQRRNDPGLDPQELAAYAVVASMILNLDETITKQ